ncbi:hypothetical protein [Geobacillus stearothermophilus]|uniref:hypothetical protein n=1 Tax=Geobacillus stearothermophilus TaxID=1422 RepID=UPI003D1E931A
MFGASPDAVSLASFAAKTGFSVTVCDWRAALCNKKIFLMQISSLLDPRKKQYRNYSLPLGILLSF